MGVHEEEASIVDRLPGGGCFKHRVEADVLEAHAPQVISYVATKGFDDLPHRRSAARCFLDTIFERRF